MNLEKFQHASEKGLSLVMEKHEQHDQKTHGNWANGEVPTAVGSYTLDASSDPMGLTTYNHPNGSRVVFQGIDNYYDDDANPTPEKKEKIGQALEIIDSLQTKYPLENLTIAFENDPDGENVVVYPVLGQAINIQRSAMSREELEGNARPVGLLSKDLPNGKPAGSYIVINSKILGNDPNGVPYTFKTFAEANYQTADPNHLIGNDLPVLLSTLTHEYGHALDFRTESDAKFAWMNMDDSSTSNYGRTNSREYFAETFTAWELDKNNPKWQKAFLWLGMEKIGTKVNKSVGDGILFIVKDRFDGGEPFLQEFGEVSKHGTHDQKTHGSWANISVDGQTVEGKTITGLIDKLSEKKTPGFTIDIRTKKSPKDGFIASDYGAERPLSWAPLKASRAALRTALKDYINDHAELLDNKGSFFGAWVEQGKLYLDVSRRYNSRSEGVRAGFKNKQKAIYDVVNDSYIFMKDEVDDRANKASISGNSQASQGNDGAGEGRLRGRNLGSDRGQSLNRHVCLGRYTVEKHRDGQHDQATHGNWAGDRYPTDSVKGARDGAKEYAFKKGLNPDETIDYTKVVANRERASKIADVYENLPKMDRDAVDEYEALASEVEEQFDFMTKTLGVKVEFVAEDPYKTSKEMFDDVSRGSLKVLQTETTGAHPLFSDAQNNKFRAVHDYFGHAATGRGFGQDGEEAAWVHHSQMFTLKARAALTTETRGQNSFFNNRGKQFADQKVALLPEEFWAVPATFSKVKIIRFAAGLKPIFKHQEHDQSSHGNWARGVSAEDEALINYMDGKGPTLDEIAAALGGGDQPSLQDLVDFVNNDSSLYSNAIEGIEEVIAERYQNLSPEEYDQVYDREADRMIDEYIANADLAGLWQEAQGDSFNPEDFHGAFDEVFGMTYEVKNAQGEVATTLSSSTNNIYLDGERLVVTGEIKDDADNWAGEFQRAFYKSQDGDGNEIWAVEHDLFKMEDDYAGVGFGSKFIAQQEAWYVAAGIGRIDVGTAWDGARHWAKAGFDFDARSMDQNVEQLVRGRGYNSADFAEGSANRLEFDSLMSKMVTEYDPSSKDVSYFDRPKYGSVKPITSDDFPIPHDFLMIGYKDRVQVGTNQFTGKPVYSWAGAKLLDGLHMKYQKGLSKEGRSIIQGPIDRDGDGLVYDGTPREKPAPRVN
jgi:hypothetical protein